MRDRRWRNRRAWVSVTLTLSLVSAVAAEIIPSTGPAAAVAASANTPNGTCDLCVLNPSGTGLSLNGNAALSLLRGNVMVDSTSSQAVTLTGNASISAPSVGVVGGVSSTSSGTVSHLTTGAAPISDPLAGAPIPSLARPASPPSVALTGTTQRAIFPGVYRDISVAGSASLTLNTGTYVILHDFSVSGQSVVSGRGVTLYLACSNYPSPCARGQQGASLEFMGTGRFSLTAPTGICSAGQIAIQSDPNNTSTVSLVGNSSDTLSGSIYAPSGGLSLNGLRAFALGGQVVVGRASFRGNGAITLPTGGSPVSGAKLSLSPVSSGPDQIGSAQDLTGTLTDASGQPVANEQVGLEVSGANTANASGLTGNDGQVKLSYTGVHAGRDTAKAFVGDGDRCVDSNSATVSWIAHPAPIATGPVQGNFFAAPAAAQTFTATPSSTPLFGQEFPVVDFNPPAGLVPGNTSGVDPHTRPFTDVTTNVAGDYTGTTVAQGNGVQAGVGSAQTFDAVLNSTFTVSTPGDVSFQVIADDGFLLGVGNGATAVSGPSNNPPASGVTPFSSYPVMAAWNALDPGPPATYTVTVHFPTAGTYPYELDYFSRSSELSLVLTVVAGGGSPAPPLAVFSGYADTVRPPGNSTFPFPWQGTPGVTFVGSPNPDGSWDSGALRFDNTTTSPITIDHATVDIGTQHFDPGWTNVVVPPNGTAVLAGSGQLTSGLPTGRGGIYITGHDPDYHGYVGANATGAQHILQRAVDWVTFGKSNPKMLLVTDLRNPGGDQSDPRLGLTAAGFSYDVADDGSSGQALDLHTVDFSSYDVVVVASDYGGWLRQEELDILNARSSELISFVNHGGGVVALAECGCRGNGTGTTHDRFGFLPAIVSSAALNQGESGYTMSSTGTAMGLTTSDINGNASHNIFTSAGGLSPVDFDPSGDIISLTERGLQVGQSNFDTSDPDAAATGGTTSGPGPTTPVSLVPVSTNFNTPIGIDYYQPTNQILTSVNYSGGEPNNFDLIAADGSHSVFGSTNGLTDEVYMSAIRTSGCEGGFTPGDVYFGTGQPGAIARLSNGGAVLTNPWVTLPGESGLLRGGVFQDIYCVAGGDLIVTTSAGNVWRVTSTGAATEVASNVGDTLEGPTTVPNQARYGPWAGQILVSSENCGCVQSIDPNTGAHATWGLGQGNVTGSGVGSAEAVHLVPANENFYGTDYGNGTVVGAPASQFSGEVGDVVVATEFPGRLVDLRWDATNHVFASTDLLTSNAGQFEGTAFAPAAIAPLTSTCTGNTAVPQIHVTVAGVTTTYADSAGTLTNAGQDAECGTAGNESHQWTQLNQGAPTVQVPMPPAITLALSPSTLPGAVVGKPLNLSVAAVDSSGQAVSQLPVTLAVNGANPQQLSAVTDASGAASFTYTGNNAGTDTLTVTAFVGGALQVSNTLSAVWTIPLPGPSPTSTGQSAPTIFGLSPPDQTTVSAPTPISATIQAPSGFTIAHWSVTSTPLSPGGTSTSLASGSGSPPSTLATFDPTGQPPGTYAITVSATSNGGGSASAVTRLIIAGSGTGGGAGGSSTQAPPSISQPSPPDGTVVTSPVPIQANFTPPAGETIASWSVVYQALDPEPPVTLASGTGTPPATLATFDPTLLPNDTYALTISATASGGGTQSTTTTVSVSGSLKLGRYVTTYQDLNVPVNGFEMQVLRGYDSTDKRTGDFGVGWHVSVSNFRTSPNRQLGANGWSEYTTGCFILCSWAWKTSVPHYVTVTWPDGHQEVFDFTPSGPQMTLFDFNQGTAAFTARPGTGTTSTLMVTDPAEQTFSAGGDGSIYDSAGNLYNPTRFTLTTRDGRTVVLDTNAGLVSETDTHGNSLSVDSNGIHSSSGQSISFARDSVGRITQITGPSGQTVKYTYGGTGDLASSTDANGTTSYSYDANHNLLTATGSGSQPLVSLSYDSSGRLVAITDGDGNTTSVTDSVPGQTQTVTDPSGRLTTIYTFDALGDLLQQSAAGSGAVLTTTTSYDAQGRPLSVTDPLGRSTAATYDAEGNVLATTDAGGNTTQIAYNTLGKPTTVTDPDGTVSVAATYDGQGNLVSTKAGDGSTVSGTYNSSGQLVQVQDAAGNLTNFQYDSRGDVTQATDALGHNTTATFDASGRPQSMTDAAGSTTQFTYDAAGNLTKTVDAKGNDLTTTYDSQGRVVSQTSPLGTGTYTYDPAGRVVSTTGPRGTTSYTYDADGHLTGITSPTGQTTTYAYDAFGRLTTATNASAVISQTFDGDGEILSQTTQLSGTGAPPATTVSYSYDSSGHQHTRTGPDGTTTYGYDTLGRLTSLVDPNGGLFSLGYDGASRPVSLTRPNGVDDTLTYNQVGQLTERKSVLGSSVIADSAYQVDATGHRVAETTPAGTTTYLHDAAGRLLTVTPPTGPASSYSYDAVGNRTSQTGAATVSYSYNSADQLLSAGPSTYTYDAVGQLIHMANASNGTTTSFGWDGFGQLTQVANPDGTTATYAYDPLGRRVRVTEAGQTMQYVYDGDNIAYEFDGSGHLAASYVFLPGVDQPLEMQRGGRASYYIQDGNSNVVALTGASGGVQATYSYDAFGRPIASSGGVANPFTFGAREYDPHNGLYYFRSRYYDPVTSRFISPDPAGALNPYAYTANDPVDNVDPSGAMLAEYAPLLPQQIQMATHLSGFVRCIGLAMLAGLDGASPDTVHELLKGAADQYAGITDITGLVFGSSSDKVTSAGDMTVEAIGQANEAFTTVTTSSVSIMSVTTIRISWYQAVAGVRTIQGAGGNAIVRAGYFYDSGGETVIQEVRYTSVISTAEHEPWPLAGGLSEFAGSYLFPGLDLASWYEDTCNMRCG